MTYRLETVAAALWAVLYCALAYDAVVLLGPFLASTPI